MPNRIIKESICVSDSIDQLSWFEEVLFYRLIVTVDDYGRFDGRVPVIKNRLFPLKDNVTAKSVKDGINKLGSVGLVFLYECDGKPYLHLPTWNDHQNVRAKKSKYPAPQEGVNTSACICNHVQADVPVIQSLSESVSLSESNAEVPDVNVGKSPARAKRFVPPTVEDVRAYCEEKGYSLVNPERFVSYYTSNGWMVGKTKMKDWKSAVAGWQSREKERLGKETKGNYTHGADRLAAMIGRGDFDD